MLMLQFVCQSGQSGGLLCPCDMCFSCSEIGSKAPAGCTFFFLHGPCWTQNDQQCWVTILHGEVHVLQMEKRQVRVARMRETME